MSFFSKLFSGDKNPLDRYFTQIGQVNSVKDEIEKLSQEEIRKEISGLKLEIGKLQTDKEIFEKLQEIAPRVFALAREAAKRAIGQFHYDVQVAGGFVLSQGKIAEMKTGE